MDKITASLGAGASGLMFGKSMASLVGGKFGPGAGVLSFLATTVLPVAWNWADKLSESTEEKNARLDAWAVSAAEKAQVAKQEEQNLQSQLEQQSELAYQATYAESGSLDQIQSIQEANDISQQLIDKYKLEAGKDFACVYENNKDVGTATITITGTGKVVNTITRYGCAIQSLANDYNTDDNYDGYVQLMLSSLNDIVLE